MKKYELLANDKIIVDGKTLYRLRALRDFGEVKAGGLGGYIEGEHNLSHEGDCWVGGRSCVYGNAAVSDDAMIYGNAKAYDNAKVYDAAQVYGNVEIWGERAGTSQC